MRYPTTLFDGSANRGRGSLFLAAELHEHDHAPARQGPAKQGVARCHKQAIFAKRIESALGVSLDNVQCNIVHGSEEMGRVMGRHGWSKNDAQGVVGFQVGKEIFVLDSASWTVLHEMVHRAGVNADRLSRYVAEGLTECIAADLKESPDEHKATYPEEVAWVRGTLLPLLDTTPIALGRVIAASQDPPRTLADLVVAARAKKGLPAIDRRKLVDELRPQVPGKPSFNRPPSGLSGSRAPDLRTPAVPDSGRSGWVLGVGTAFLTAGALLILATGGSDD